MQIKSKKSSFVFLLCALSGTAVVFRLKNHFSLAYVAKN